VENSQGTNPQRAIVYQFQSLYPAAEIEKAELEWREEMSCLKELTGKKMPSDFLEKCSLIFLRSLRELVAADLPPAYLAKRDTALPEIEDVWNEWAKTYALGMPIGPAEIGRTAISRKNPTAPPLPRRIVRES